MVNILIVDDSAGIRKILMRVLQKAGIPIGSVLEAGDGKEAIDALGRQNVGLILSDINMPNMNGLELLSFLKSSEHWKDVPIVMVSTEGSEAKVREAAQLGAAGYLRKPFTVEQVTAKLAEFF